MIGPIIKPLLTKLELFDASFFVLSSVAALWREERRAAARCKPVSFRTPLKSGEGDVSQVFFQFKFVVFAGGRGVPCVVA